jgi:SNF2 family DNA or RNA helicase
MITLRPYQIEISEKACSLIQQYKIAYLSMQVRTGKTLTSLYAADKYLSQKEWANVLFLTKKKAISSIENDCELLKPKYKLLVTNYESIGKVADKDFDLIICDEAHCLGQFPQPAERTKQLKELCKGKPIIYLSGTPTPESYSQIYHQFWISEFSPFDEYTTFYKWATEFVDKKKRYFYNREITDYSKARQANIDNFCKHLFISCTQEEAGFIQNVQEHVLKVRMKDVTYNLADKMRKKRVHIGSNGEEIVADTEVKLMQKLHQIYSGTVIADNIQQPICFDTSKVEFIKQQFMGKKIAIFYKFRAEELMLKKYFNTTSDPDFFNKYGYGNGVNDLVFISQIQSGREGIDLSTADCLIMLNIDFSSVSYQQARARLQSKNRTKECLLYWIFCDGGIEEKIYKSVMGKQDYTLSYFKRDFKIKSYEPTRVSKVG